MDYSNPSMNHNYKPQSSSSSTTTSNNLTSTSSSSSKSLSQRLQNLDLQNTIPPEFRIYTTSGALLSFFTILILLYLFATEYTYNLTPSLKTQTYVNTTSNQLIEIEIDITFDKIPCNLLAFDADDPNGQKQSLHVDKDRHRVWKHRIGKDGRLIGRKSKVEKGMTLRNEEHIKDYAHEKQIKFSNSKLSKEEKEKLKMERKEKKKNYHHEGAIDDYYDDDDEYYDDDHHHDEYYDECGSCYGAGEEDECCNTCDDVKRAYQRKGWSFTPNMDVKQCHDNPNTNEMIGEGCNIHGMVALESGGGNLHITPGHELENFGKTFAFKDLNDLVEQAFETFNVTHTIRKLRFGREYPGHLHQLDGQKRFIDDTHGMYQYYFQIVPTEFVFLNGTTIQTNQYSVIEHLRHVQPNTNRGLPGVYFYYEVSPLHVRIEEYRHGWIRFFTSVAAVIGGVFSSMKMMDAYIFSKTANNNGILKY